MRVNGLRWFAGDARRSTSTVEGAFATALTGATFLVAFISMTRVRATQAVPPNREHVDAIHFTIAAPPRVAQSQPRSRPLLAEPPSAMAPSAIVGPISIGSALVPGPRTIDTAVASIPRYPIPLRGGLSSESATGTGSSAARSSAGITNSGMRTSDLTAAERTRRVTSAMTRAQVKAKERGLTPDEKAELRLRQAPGLSPIGRAARLPGEPMYAPLMNGGASVAIVLVGPDRDPRDRRREDSVHADYVARLNRLQNIIIARRDSVHLDSLRRDSLARASVRP